MSRSPTHEADYGREYRKARQALISAWLSDTRDWDCCFCHKPLSREAYRRDSKSIHANHVPALRDGWKPGDKLALSHRLCNLRDNKHKGEVRPSPGKSFPETSSKAAYKVITKRKALHDIAYCDHDLRRCEHRESAIWGGCPECQRYSKAITMHAPCPYPGEVAEYYTDEGLPAWDIPDDVDSLPVVTN